MSSNSGPAPKIDVISSTTAREVDSILARAEGSMLQVGSRAAIVDRQENRWRALAASKGVEFTGLDIEAGDNVDVVADLCAPFAAIDRALGGRRFGLVVCQHVLEHVKQPWVAAENVARLARPGGFVYVAVPWVQAYHGYPCDYWRFSFHGLALLFAGLEAADMYYSASGTGFDAAYKVLVDGKVDIARTPFELEGKLFQLLFERDENRKLIEAQSRLHGPKLILARGYLPVILINLLLRRPAAKV